VITDHAVADFNIHHTFKKTRLINTGTFKPIYYEFKNRFETRIDVEVRARIRATWFDSAYDKGWDDYLTYVYDQSQDVG